MSAPLRSESGVERMREEMAAAVAMASESFSTGNSGVGDGSTEMWGSDFGGDFGGSCGGGQRMRGLPVAESHEVAGSPAVVVAVAVAVEDRKRKGWGFLLMDRSVEIIDIRVKR